MKNYKIGFMATGLALLLGACANTAAPPAKVVKDGELKIPADYPTWPRFLSAVQRPDARQVREVWINPLGATAKPGEMFPNGTQSVMELYAAKANADGTLATGADGKLVKGNLLKIFIMGKDAGWGASAPEGLKNGDWVYSAFLADGKTPSGDPITPCRACHLPLAGKDFVPRYDEYFQNRMTSPGY